MGISVLLAATATRWAGPARLPRELVRAGFDVAVLAPKGALLAESRYVGAVTRVPDAATPMQWAYMLAADVEQHAPQLIVPCDDTTLQLMMSFVESPPEGFGRPLRERLLALIRESLGDPKYGSGASMGCARKYRILGRPNRFSCNGTFPVGPKRSVVTRTASSERILMLMDAMSEFEASNRNCRIGKRLEAFH